jgi:AcrR family transcriptional regulator
VKCPVCSTPRPRNAPATREALLVAARRRFIDESYDSVGLRDIAGDAGIDVSLVHRYFGSKEGLFKEVLRSGKKKFNGDIPAGQLPQFLAATIIDQDCGNRGEHADRLLIIIRSASSAKAAEIVRQSMRDDVLQPIARLLDGGNPEIRASLCMALIIGMTIQRTIMCIEAQPDCDPEFLRRKLVQMFEVALNGPDTVSPA